MARGKKKETLTPEERLQAALVPESEQPYPVPGNWCWTRMENIAQWGSGGTPSRKIPEYYNGDIPWIKTGELNDDYIFETEEHITEEAIFHSSAKLFPVNTVAIAMYGATIGKVGILGVTATTNQACACGVSNPSTNYKYLFYYARSQRDNFIKKGKGGAQPNISQEIIKSHEFPLPPLSEQQRIVDRIESLFAKLDEAKQKAQDALDSFETRKAAILHKAFTGELTAKWRKEHGVGMESWETKPLGEFLEIITYGFTNPMPDADIGPWKITAKSIHDGYIDYSISRKTTQEAFDNLLTDKSRPHINDVLLTKDGSIGRVAVVDRAGICINQSVALLRPTSKVKPNFLRDLLQSPEKQKIMELQSGGTALKHIYITRVDKMEISIPSLAEQVEICNLVNSFIAKEQQAKEAAEGVLEQIDLIKKAILARAFRGELGTNDPSEESAVELLKQVL